jgi:hypothetical protein
LSVLQSFLQEDRSVQLGGLPVESDVSSGVWVSSGRRRGVPGTVGALVPAVFEAYARVFHPAARFAGLEDVDVTWAEVAAANVTVAHPAMEWASITGLMEYLHSGDQSPLWDMAPALGHLPVQVARRLVDILGRHTTTRDDCWFGVWSGFACFVADGPTLSLPRREHWLLRGPVELAAENLAPEPEEQSASLWWPADRSWAVATDIDLVTTYVGGSAACVAEIVTHPGLEAAKVPVSQGLSWNTDTVNPLPLDGPD